MAETTLLNALTVDVEDYFMVAAFSDIVSFDRWGGYDQRVARNTGKVLDLLDRHGVKATFFVVGWVAEKHPGVVKSIQARGHEIGCHSYSHGLVYAMTPAEFRRDTHRGRALLEDLTGERVRGYRAPSYSIVERSLWALDVLIEEGFTYDSSVFPVHHDIYGYPDFDRFAVRMKRDGAGEILEIPLSTVRILGRNLPFGGGGYLRLFPISLTERGIRGLNEREGRPAVVYVHPWEFDPEQPRLNGRRLSMFRHYVNIGKTEKKFERLLGQFRFGPVREAFKATLG